MTRIPMLHSQHCDACGTLRRSEGHPQNRDPARLSSAAPECTSQTAPHRWRRSNPLAGPCGRRARSHLRNSPKERPDSHRASASSDPVAGNLDNPLTAHLRAICDGGPECLHEPTVGTPSRRPRSWRPKPGNPAVERPRYAFPERMACRSTRRDQRRFCLAGRSCPEDILLF